MHIIYSSDSQSNFKIALATNLLRSSLVFFFLLFLDEPQLQLVAYSVPTSIIHHHSFICTSLAFSFVSVLHYFCTQIKGIDWALIFLKFLFINFYSSLYENPIMWYFFKISHLKNKKSIYFIGSVNSWRKLNRNTFLAYWPFFLLHFIGVQGAHVDLIMMYTYRSHIDWWYIIVHLKSQNSYYKVHLESRIYHVWMSVWVFYMFFLE